MKLRKFEDQRVVPWRNGGGFTREIAVSRSAGSPDEFLWRVSAATVSAAGPFSRFEGIDRTIAVIAGDGLVLATGTDRVTLTTDSAPYAFDGETEIDAYSVDGPTIDLNVMTRRGRVLHSMSRLMIDQPVTIVSQVDVAVLVFCGEVGISAGETSMIAGKGDALVDIARGKSLSLCSAARVAAYLVEISSVA